MKTATNLGVAADDRALDSNFLALSNSLFSISNLKAASQMSSELEESLKVIAKMFLAAGTSTAIYLHLAPMKHETSTFAEFRTAFCDNASNEDCDPCFFSK
jgi:hypothetical protein